MPSAKPRMSATAAPSSRRRASRFMRLVGALVREVRAAPVEEPGEGQAQGLVGVGGAGRVRVEPDEEPLEGRGGELPRDGHRSHTISIGAAARDGAAARPAPRICSSPRPKCRPAARTLSWSWSRELTASPPVALDDEAGPEVRRRRSADRRPARAAPRAAPRPGARRRSACGDRSASSAATSPDRRPARGWRPPARAPAYMNPRVSPTSPSPWTSAPSAVRQALSTTRSTGRRRL